MSVMGVKLLAEPLDRAYLTCIRYSAARVGEINKLTWGGVNFEREAIRLYTGKKAGSNSEGWLDSGYLQGDRRPAVCPPESCKKPPLGLYKPPAS